MTINIHACLPAHGHFSIFSEDFSNIYYNETTIESRLFRFATLQLRYVLQSLLNTHAYGRPHLRGGLKSRFPQSVRLLTYVTGSRITDPLAVPDFLIIYIDLHFFINPFVLFFFLVCDVF